MLLKSKICNLQSKILDNVLINFRFKFSDQRFRIMVSYAIFNLQSEIASTVRYEISNFKY